MQNKWPQIVTDDIKARKLNDILPPYQCKLHIFMCHALTLAKMGSPK